MHSDDNTKVHVNKFFRRAMIFDRQKKTIAKKVYFHTFAPVYNEEQWGDL